jgi:hypothetical protein
VGTDDPLATGVVDALVCDHLLGLGVEDPFSLSQEQRLAVIKQALVDGRLAPDQGQALRELGVSI